LNDEDFLLVDEIEETHWWFVGKRHILRAILPDTTPIKRVLDLGCGTGGILRDWMNRSRCFGIDRSAVALKYCAEAGFDTLVRGDVTQLPFQNESFDTIFLMDVIEHLDDDVGFLESASELCTPGGQLVVAVPAFQLLWSQHDDTYHHKRRYTAKQLRAVIAAAGLTPERTTYTNSLLFPVALVWRVLSYRLGLGRFAPTNDFWPVPASLNALLTALYRFEAWMLGRVNLPVGVSVVCIARKAHTKPDTRAPALAETPA
jgi:2-polyprenyl-3-methyl-5-hydroxy-6-metoxy-1,4-benzoquinol methylase